MQIINPETSKVVETKIFKRANYPKIFNIVLSKKIATTLELNMDNPYVEVYEVRKNKTFVAKETNIFEEEKKVAVTVPVDDIKMDEITETKPIDQKKSDKESNFIVVISDFYYFDTAMNLKTELFKQTQINNFSIKNVNNKFRLLAGPFKNFNALKSTYISLNNLGFEDLDIIREKK